MFIRIGFDLSFEIPAQVPMILMLYVHPSRASSLLQSEVIYSNPSLPIYTYIDSFGNRCGRIIAPAGQLRLWHETIVRDSGLPDATNLNAIQQPVQDIPDEHLRFLLGSRYCEIDRLLDVAWNLFGSTPMGWPRVQAVCNWVHGNVKFGYQFARSTKTAFDTYTERQGVCRDFTHLLITFLRCLNIPARYATGYLGDIGVPPDPAPMDFSAWTEVYLNGQWYTWDARHNHTRIGRIVMARGRDAADVALTTSFGAALLKKFIVVTQETSASAVNLPINIMPIAAAGA